MVSEPIQGCVFRCIPKYAWAKWRTANGIFPRFEGGIKLMDFPFSKKGKQQRSKKKKLTNDHLSDRPPGSIGTCTWALH